MTTSDSLDLKQPEHLDNDTWAAVEEHRQRLVRALRDSDRPLALGSAKDLVESVGRAVADGKGLVVPSDADFSAVVNAAHTALQRQPGPDVSMSAGVRHISASMKRMVVGIRDVRNEVGTGHGRAEVYRIQDEMVSVVVESTMVWVRWALRRLEHILIGEADELIRELRDEVVYRDSLQRHLEAVEMPNQAPEVQHAIGVAFGQRTARNTGNALTVGVEPAVASDDLAAWPPAYRFGIVEGLVIDRWGYRSAPRRWVPTIVSVLQPIPPKEATAGIDAIVGKLAQSNYPNGQYPAEELDELRGEMSAEAERLPAGAREAWGRLIPVFEPQPDEDEPAG